MQPAFSVIFFTVFSGAGYGLIALMGGATLLNWVETDTGFGIAAFLMALGGISAGLLSSTFHLGHPERAWRAVTQWRSSWLSREGIVAIVAYVPIVIFAGIWVFEPDTYASLLNFSAFFSIIFAAVTIYCTAQIYASLKTIRQWNNGWTIALYMALGLSTGALWFVMLAIIFFDFNIVFVQITSALLIVSMFVKSRYWAFIDNGQSASTSATATGFAADITVRQTESPHTQNNYLLNEMGYTIAQKHSHKLRRIVVVTAFIMPVASLLLSPFIPVVVAQVLIVLAAIIGTFGVLLERWLFFAEARHTVTLFYGADKV